MKIAKKKKSKVPLGGGKAPPKGKKIVKSIVNKKKKTKVPLGGGLTPPKEKKIAKPIVNKTRPFTSAEVRAILAKEDNTSSTPSFDWVRRSTRQPSRSAITAKNVRMLVDLLEMNDADMEVLKLKKYISDPDTPCVILDAILDALESNTNCQALYVQVCVNIVQLYLYMLQTRLVLTCDHN